MQNNTFFGHYQPLSIIVLESTASTNDYSKQLLTNFKPQIGFTAIMAKHQSAGRGQRGTSWLATANTNMTASFIYTPEGLSITNQFAVTVHASLAVYDVLKEILQKDIYIKWPNDIIVGKRKIAGILIENKVSGHFIKTVIAGIGLNVYQKEFASEIAHKTTSLVLENPTIDLSIFDLVKRIQKRLQDYRHILQEDGFMAHLKLYNERLFLKDTNARFTVNGNSIEGRIQGVESDGHLIIRHKEEIKKYDLKELAYQL